MPMYLGGSEQREGSKAVLEAAVVEWLGPHSAFDGVLGQDVLGQFPVGGGLCVFCVLST